MPGATARVADRTLDSPKAKTTWSTGRTGRVRVGGNASMSIVIIDEIKTRIADANEMFTTATHNRF